VGPVPAARPALAAAQSTTGPTATATAAVGGGAGGLVAIGGGSKGAPARGAGAAGIRPSSVGAGGRGLGSGQPAPAAGRPRAAQVCFGAMPGMAATGSPLACHRTSS
jgi:hypothetical protein